MVQDQTDRPLVALILMSKRELTVIAQWRLQIGSCERIA
jgi:hypothetical protein